jgi:hypothetical protein
MNTDVHRTHCCRRHGCKYGNSDCPVALKQVKQAFACEECGETGLARTRYRFAGRDGYGNYVWESVLTISAVDSRHEQITVNPTWFWARYKP